MIIALLAGKKKKNTPGKYDENNTRRIYVNVFVEIPELPYIINTWPAKGLKLKTLKHPTSKCLMSQLLDHTSYEHMAKWIEHWTQDQKVWGWISSTGKLHIPHCLSCGYLVHSSKVGSIVAGCIGSHLARGKVNCVGLYLNALTHNQQGTWTKDLNLANVHKSDVSITRSCVMQYVDYYADGGLAVSGNLPLSIDE